MENLHIVFAAQAAMPAMYEERVAIALGIITLIAALLTVTTCRSFLNLLHRLGVSQPLDSKPYRSLYNSHVYYWWVVLGGLVSHVTMAIYHTGLPVAGDRDTPIHWAILGLGLASFLAILISLSSCRVIPMLSNFTHRQSPMTYKGYRSFFRTHSYVWLAFIAVVAAHFAVGYMHAGIWPQ